MQSKLCFMVYRQLMAFRRWDNSVNNVVWLSDRWWWRVVQ